MKVLSGKKIKDAIQSCNPSNIAVAFVGCNWNSYLRNIEALESVIISPTIGSNPYAINDIVKKIGWSKVHFLDSLHAKIYIGDQSAVVGSANLTNNGLDGQRLLEISVSISEENELLDLNNEFEELLNKAKKLYPSTEIKKIKLNQLFDLWHNAISNGVITSASNNENSFDDFELLSNDQFYVAWFQLAESEYSDEVKAVESVISEGVHFREEDEVEKNKWVLMWRITDKSKPHLSAKPYWLFIHDIFKDGIIDEGYAYTKLAVQRNDKEIPIPPFELTGEVIKALKTSVSKEDLEDYMIQDYRDAFDLNHSKKGLPGLISSMKQTMTNK